MPSKEPWPAGIIGPLVRILNTLGDADEQHMRAYLDEVLALMRETNYQPEHDMLHGIAKFLGARILELEDQ